MGSTLDFRGPGRNSQAEKSLPRKCQGPAPLSSPPALRHCWGRDAGEPGLWADCCELLLWNSLKKGATWTAKTIFKSQEGSTGHLHRGQRRCKVHISGWPTFFFISLRLITLQYCSGFCHTLTWISHGFTCIPHPNPPSHLPLLLLDCPLPLGVAASSVPVVLYLRQRGAAPESLSNTADVGCVWTGDFLPLPTESSEPSSVFLSVLQVVPPSSAVWRTDLRSWESRAVRRPERMRAWIQSMAKGESGVKTSLT